MRNLKFDKAQPLNRYADMNNHPISNDIQLEIIECLAAMARFEYPSFRYAETREQIVGRNKNRQ